MMTATGMGSHDMYAWGVSSAANQPLLLVVHNSLWSPKCGGAQGTSDAESQPLLFAACSYFRSPSQSPDLV